MARNLLKNPNGQENLKHWSVDCDSKWNVVNNLKECGFLFNRAGISTYFVVSSPYCLKKQVIDLKAQGFTFQQLDKAPPVTVEDWYSGKTNLGCIYEMKVTLQNENQDTIDEFKMDPVNLDPVSLWNQVTYTFKDYGPGLRFISFEHGSHCSPDRLGLQVTGSSVTVEV